MPNKIASNPIAVALPASVPTELVSEAFDVREAVLKAHMDRVVQTLTGPDPQPVFLPETDPTAQNYRGLLLLPIQRPKTPLTP